MFGVLWSSTDEDVATIDPSGVATGVSPGTTTITATSGSISGNTTLTVEGNTSTGSNVTVSPGSGVTLTFTGVTAAGDTTVTTSGTGPAVPAGFQLGVPPTYYDISTTAAFTPPVTVCLAYNPAQYTDINTLSLLHYESGNWMDVTTSNDTVNFIICGQVNSFSLFVIAEAVAPPAASVPARIYLANQNENAPSIVAVDPATDAVTASIPVSGTPGELVAHPDGSTVYAMTGTDLSVIDVASNQVVNTVTGVGDFFNLLAISPDGSRLYLAYRQLVPSTLIIKVFNTSNPTAPTLSTTISSNMFNPCYGALGLAVSPDGSQLYMACRIGAGGNPDRFYMINTATNTPTQTATYPRENSNYMFINALTVSPDGSRVYIARAHSAGSTVEYFNGTTGVRQGAIPLPANALPRAAAFTPDGSKLYVTDQVLGTHVINPATNTRTTTLAQSKSRGLDIAMTADGHAYTTLLFEIHDLNATTNSWVATLPGGSDFNAAYQITATPGHP